MTWPNCVLKDCTPTRTEVLLSFLYVVALAALILYVEWVMG